MKRIECIVIGAGIGGIAAAVHLAHRGAKVTVIEKNARAGGRCDRLVVNGHRFDTGPTLLVMPLVYAAEFAALGTPLERALTLQRVDPTYHLIFDDGDRLALTSDMKALYDQLETREAGSFGAFLRYMEEGRSHYDLAMQHLVNRDFRTAGDFFNPAMAPLLARLKPLSRHFQHMERYFASPRLRAAFTFQDVYMGLSPFDAPATFSMMPYTELAHGVWYPKGGMYAIVEALMQMALDCGVEFVFENTIKEIVVEGDRAEGVRLEGGEIMRADIVLANADLPYVYDALLPNRNEARSMRSKRFSSSAISFFWSLDRCFPELPPHALFLADAYAENFEAIESKRPLPAKPSLYVHAPARLDADAAPVGKDTVIAVVPVGHLDSPMESSDQEEEACVAQREVARAAVFERLKLLGIADFERHIGSEINYTPLSWRARYHLEYGATHGLAHSLFQLGYLRPHNRHARYRNLYFVGASTHPGTGVPTALISARLAAERIGDEMRLGQVLL